MDVIRPSVPGDIPAQRALWALAFGDSGPYVDNFYQTYYRPERMLVLEEEGAVRAMTAWFDTRFVLPGEGSFRAAYLYAVATHPQCRGRGLARALLAWADGYFRSIGVEAVTTVPAQPSLHRFFGDNGFRECFTHTQGCLAPPFAPGGDGAGLEPLSPGAYAALREERLSAVPHIALPEEAVAYQAGACALAPGGGLYALPTAHGPAALCAEGLEDGSLLAKELLAPPGGRGEALDALGRLLPGWSGCCRFPGEEVPFGMLKWLDAAREERWDWTRTAYLGLAFD